MNKIIFDFKEPRSSAHLDARNFRDGPAHLCSKKIRNLPSVFLPVL